MTPQQKKKKIREHFINDEIIFNPKMRDLKQGQTIVDEKGRIGTVTMFDPTGKQMFNRAQRYHAVCARFSGHNYDDCLQWNEVFCLVNVKEVEEVYCNNCTNDIPADKAANHDGTTTLCETCYQAGGFVEEPDETEEI